MKQDILKYKKEKFCSDNLLNDKFKPILKLNPDFITGLTESKGSFSITKHKDSRAKFKINMVKYFFSCGFILHNKKGIIDFTIRDMNCIKNILIPHFLKYPLRGTKHLDFMYFKKAFDIINCKEHLTEKGIDELIKISNNMNSYRKFSISTFYSPFQFFFSLVNLKYKDKLIINICN